LAPAQKRQENADRGNFSWRYLLRTLVPLDTVEVISEAVSALSEVSKRGWGWNKPDRRGRRGKGERIGGDRK